MEALVASLKVEFEELCERATQQVLAAAKQELASERADLRLREDALRKRESALEQREAALSELEQEFHANLDRGNSRRDVGDDGSYHGKLTGSLVPEQKMMANANARGPLRSLSGTPTPARAKGGGGGIARDQVERLATVPLLRRSSARDEHVIEERGKGGEKDEEQRLQWQEQQPQHEADVLPAHCPPDLASGRSGGAVGNFQSAVLFPSTSSGRRLPGTSSTSSLTSLATTEATTSEMLHAGVPGSNTPSRPSLAAVGSASRLKAMFEQKTFGTANANANATASGNPAGTGSEGLRTARRTAPAVHGSSTPRPKLSLEELLRLDEEAQRV